MKLFDFLVERRKQELLESNKSANNKLQDLIDNNPYEKGSPAYDLWNEGFEACITGFELNEMFGFGDDKKKKKKKESTATSLAKWAMGTQPKKRKNKSNNSREDDEYRNDPRQYEQ